MANDLSGALDGIERAEDDGCDLAATKIWRTSDLSRSLICSVGTTIGRRHRLIPHLALEKADTAGEEHHAFDRRSSAAQSGVRGNRWKIMTGSRKIMRGFISDFSVVGRLPQAEQLPSARWRKHGVLFRLRSLVPFPGFCRSFIEDLHVGVNLNAFVVRLAVTA